jgi:hypothetical protein
MSINARELPQKIKRKNAAAKTVNKAAFLNVSETMALLKFKEMEREIRADIANKLPNTPIKITSVQFSDSHADNFIKNNVTVYFTYEIA